MADRTSIEWTRSDDGTPGATWNPTTGCTKVSPGCDHCYAETLAERFRGTPGHYFERGFDVQIRKDKVNLPLRWRKPRRVFVNSMSDLFHEVIPRPWLAGIFAVMAATPRHTYQVLTKRHGPMRSILNDDAFRDMVADRIYGKGGEVAELPAWPLPNVWLGVSVEDQKWADIRIPALLETPAAVRFLSCEPLLGPVDLTECLPVRPDQFCERHWSWLCQANQGDCTHDRIDWVIVGGESGRGARPMAIEWARSLRDQCIAAGVAFHFKQWGEWGPRYPVHSDRFNGAHDDVTGMWRVGKKAAGRELDGRTWDEYPAVAS